MGYDSARPALFELKTRPRAAVWELRAARVVGPFLSGRTTAAGFDSEDGSRPAEVLFLLLRDVPGTSAMVDRAACRTCLGEGCGVWKMSRGKRVACRTLVFVLVGIETRCPIFFGGIFHAQGERHSQKSGGLSYPSPASINPRICIIHPRRQRNLGDLSCLSSRAKKL